VDHLQKISLGGNVATTCIYCNYKEAASQTAIDLVSSLLRQLAQSRPTISENVSKLYDTHQDHRPTLRDFEEALRIEIRSYSKVFVIVDALDECTNDGTRTALLATLKNLSINLMITSRYSVTIEEKFDGVKRLDIVARDNDVRRYIETRIDHEDLLARHVKANPSLKNEIINKVVDSAKGM
jgi:hypothetical protein